MLGEIVRGLRVVFRPTACIVVAGVICCAAVAGQATQPARPATQPTTKQTEFQKTQAVLRKNMQRQLGRAMRIEGQWAIGDVLRVGRDGGQWRPISRLPVAGNEINGQLRVNGWSEPARVFGTTDNDKNLVEFSVVLWDFPQRDTLMVQTQFSGGVDSLSISENRTLSTGGRGDSGEMVALSLGQEVNDQTGVVTPSADYNYNRWGADSHNTNVGLNDTTVAGLRRKRPAEFDARVRPLLERLQLEDLLAPETALAISVLSAELTPTDEQMSTVRKLVAALDSDDYAAREAAAASLRAIGPGVVMAASRIDHATLSDQQSAALDAAIAPFVIQTPRDIEQFRGDMQFLVDCLHHGEVTIRAAAHKRLAKLAGRELAFDPVADEPARRAAIAKIRPALATMTTRPATSPGR